MVGEFGGRDAKELPAGEGFEKDSKCEDMSCELSEAHGLRLRPNQVNPGNEFPLAIEEVQKRPAGETECKNMLQRSSTAVCVGLISEAHFPMGKRTHEFPQFRPGHGGLDCA